MLIGAGSRMSLHTNTFHILPNGQTNQDKASCEPQQNGPALLLEVRSSICNKCEDAHRHTHAHRMLSTQMSDMHDWL